MARQPRLSVNTDVQLSPAVRDIAKFMRGENDSAELSTRDLMLLVSIDEMVTTGPVDFNAGVVCDRLNIKHPMVNHYFGNRDHLIAEVTVWAYRSWSHALIGAVRKAPKNAEKRIRAYIEAEIKWAKSMRSVAVLVQYPLLSSTVNTMIDDQFGAEMQRYFEYHLSIMTTLVVDLRRGTNSDLDFDISNYPRTELVLKHSREFLDATSMAWSIHGLAQWHSGTHLATTKLPRELAEVVTQKLAVQNHINQVIALAAGRRPLTE